ncbi:MAG: twin-arginine translocase TatA/TatE family subunit [Anaerolineae bacterium]|nr:twin-arginine translocase TatA/TatE family subunit [Anaerolineae bacterium]
MNLFRSLGPVELLIILAIVILIFGPGRLGKVAGELGKGIRDFRKGLSGGNEGEEEHPGPADEE